MNRRTPDEKTRLADTRGFVLPTALFVMVIMSVLAVTALRTAGNERASSRALRESGAALYAAESGLNITRATWDSTAINALGSGDSIDGGWQALTGGASYHAVIMRYDGGNQRVIGVTVEGRGAGLRGGRRTISVIITEIQSMGWAMFGKDGVEIQGGTIEGDLGTNGNLLISGASAQVDGNAIVGGTVSDHSKVTGTVSEGADPVTLNAVACPVTAYGPAPTGGTVAFDAGAGDIVLSGSNDITFANGTYYYHDFVKDGTSNMIVPVGAVVNIYISGVLDVAGNGFINGNSSSANLRIWGCGAGMSDWTITGNADVAMTVHAPNHELTIAGNGNRYGSFVAGTLIKEGTGSVAMDFTLASPTGTFVFVGGSWAQLLN